MNTLILIIVSPKHSAREVIDFRYRSMVGLVGIGFKAVSKYCTLQIKGPTKK